MADDGEFISGLVVLPAAGLGSTSGELVGNRVGGAATGQFHAPTIGAFGLAGNPIELFRYEWTTADFTARTVGLASENTMMFSVLPKAGPPAVAVEPLIPGSGMIRVGESLCYADCDLSSTLDIFDFACFQDALIRVEPYADCDGNTNVDIFDFVCSQDEFASGCS